MVKLNEYLDSEGNKQVIILEDRSDAAEAYATLIHAVLAKVITFNRKRQGEVSKILLKDWSAKCKASPNTELETYLIEFEKGLLKVLERLEIRGKRGRTIPILITERIHKWMQVLLQRRSQHMPETNPFLFPRSSTTCSHLWGSDVMKRFAAECSESTETYLHQQD